MIYIVLIMLCQISDITGIYITNIYVKTKKIFSLKMYKKFSLTYKMYVVVKQCRKTITFTISGKLH